MSDFITIANKTYTPIGTNTIVQFDICFAAALIGASKVSGAVIDLDYKYLDVSNSQVINPTFSYPDGFGGQKVATVWSDPPTINLSGDLSTGKIALVADPAHLDQNPIVGTNGTVLTVQLLVSGNVTDFPVSLQSDAKSGDNYITTADAVKHDLDGGAIPPNAPATFSGTDTGNILEDSTSYTAGGTLTVSDVDSATTVTAQTNTAGTYGTFSIAANGAWTYTADNTKLQALGGTTPTVTDTFVVTTADGTTHNIVVTLTGVNDAATFAGSSTGAVTEDIGTYTAGGTLTVSDVDSATTVTAQTNTVGTYGTFSIGTNGVWTYTADNTKLQALGGTTPTATDSFAVTTADGTTHNIVATLTGVNDAATFSGSFTGGVTEESGSYTAGGTLTVSDVDSATTVTAQTNTAGTYGTFSIAANGAWTYTADNTKLQALGGTTPTVTDTFVVTTADGTTHNIVVTLTGVNDAATFTGSSTGAVTEDSGTYTAGGTLTVSDVDSATTVTAQTNTAGTYGTFSIGTNGVWTYTADNTKLQELGGTTPTATDTFVVATADGTTHNIVLTLTGVNDAATFTGSSTGGVTEESGSYTAGGTLTVSDVDSATTITAQIDTAGTYGTFSIGTNSVWTYTADNTKLQVLGGTTPTATDTFAVTTADGTTHNVVVTLTGVNDAATFTGSSTGAVTEDSGTYTAGGTLTVSDVDSATTVIAQTNTAGTYGTFSIGTNGVWTYTADNMKLQALGGTTPTATDTFGVTTADGTTHNIVVTLTGVNDAATFSGSSTGSVTEESGTYTAGGTLTVGDIDSVTTVTAQTNTAGTYGIFSIAANGVWTYTADNTKLQALGGTTPTATDTFGVTTADGTTHNIVVTLTGVNDAATFSGSSTGGVTEESGTYTAGGTLTVNDVDSATTVIAQTNTAGTYGTFSIGTNGVWTYTADNTKLKPLGGTTPTATDTFAVTTADGTTHNIVVTLTGVNDAPTGNVTINGAAKQGVQLTADTSALSDIDGLGTITYQWQAEGSAINGATSSTYTLTQAEVGKTVTVMASYTDGHGTVEHVPATATGIVANVNDAPTGGVVISGTASRGAMLTVSNTLADPDGLGTISYQWKAGDTVIDGATGIFYILTAAEVGKTVTVVASYTDGYGASESVTSAATNAVAEHQNNLPTGSVTITGTATQGQLLTASNTLADVDGLGAISYQWQAAGNPINGGTSNTYTLTEAEVGKVVTVVASYTDLFGVVESKESSATSAVVNVNDAPTGSVTITGTATQNAILTASNTLADPDGLGAISYQWQAAGSAINGATSNIYTLTEAEVGKVITVVASFTDGHGTVEHVTSAATAIVANVNDSPTGSVTITGTATQNEILTASSTLADLDGLGTISYQWKAGGVDISGATGSAYTLTEAEVGKTVAVEASYTDGHGSAEHVTSTATGTVANINDAPTGSVTITGTATQGQQLTVSNTLADLDGLGTISYQWKAGGSDISGATSSSYTLTEAEVGKAVTVVASYTDGHSTAEHVTSAATAAVANVNDAPTGTVTISGSATEGQTLTADSSTLADADGLGSINYQWLADGVTIAGAVGNTLLLGASQTDKVITVQASYVDGHGTAEHVSSSATAKVVGTQSGSVQDGYLSHALVWVDANGNGKLDWNDANNNSVWDAGESATESWTVTDSTGQFTGLVGAGTIRITANLSNVVTNPQSIQTVDISTGKAFTGSYSAPSGSTVVNPLTTLVVAAGGDESKVKTALGLDASLDLSTYDPLAEANKTGASGTALATAIAVQSAATQVANIMDIAESVATGAGAASTTGVAASVAIALMTAAAGGTVSLTSSSVISGAITSAANDAGATTAGLTSVIDAVSTSSAAVNSKIADVSATAVTEANAGRTVNAENSLEQVVAAQIVAQETVAVQAKTAATDNSTAGLTITSSSVTAALDTAKSQVQTIFTNHAPTGDVTMTGTATQGQTLTENNTLADTDGLGTISYQWQSDGEDISGATCETLLLGDAQVGHQVRVVASYTDGAGKSESVNSNAATILSQHAPTGSVTITGTVANGNILTASNTLADLDSLGIISYQWYLGSDAISGATTNTWLANNLNAGDAISVKASYTDGHGTLESVSSDALHQPATNSNALQTELAAYLSNFTPADKTSADAGIVSYYNSLPSETSVSVVSRDYSAQPEGSEFTITSSGHEALYIALPDNATLTLDNAEFAIISGNNITIRGGAGDNIVFAGSGHQDIVLGIGADIIHGGADGDYIGSLAGNDQLYGDAGNDTLSGGADNDTLTGGTGDDTLDGGTGDDTAVFSHDFSKYTISFDGTHYTITDTTTTDSDGTDVVSNVEHFQFADVMKDLNTIIPAGADPYAHHEFLGMDGGETALVGLAGAGILAWVVPMIF